ncbi:hypothetical protein KPH14_001175 [Odynerus spinipes]|uniref:Fatty acyl-CoA reductase n=1 Tax=Odynerus spinipes TaxID=1348599 RepID=A0AAD9RQC9_9HYME|nr:hypothetical protein KPH14_001175 [Odynerus spinipes]
MVKRCTVPRSVERRRKRAIKMKNDVDNHILNISDFYAGKSIFITGGTGFLGKALVEKLLRSCPDIKEIFILMRPKKGMNVDDRLKKMLTLPLYDLVRETNPSAFDKIIPVKGDTAAEGLGLDPIERQVLTDRVSVIFHVAASVRFDDNLQYAVFNNTRSTRDICILAGSMKQLTALVHVSSTYAHADKPVVEETLYPAEVDWKRTIKIAENVDNNVLKTLTAKYMGPIPNTYTFTKKLAENVIADYSDRLPCVIVRPSIVISTMEDPIPGWVDNFNGPTGLMIGGGKGLLRISYADPDIISDYIPLDAAIKVIIIVGCKRGRVTVTKDPSTHVYNCASNNLTNISMGQLIALGLHLIQDIPLDNCIWSPNTKITRCPYYFYINVLIFHLLPALIIDQILKFTGHEPMLLKLQRRIYISNVSVSYFLFHQWDFRNNKIISLMAKLSGDDVKKFFFDYKNIHISNFFKDATIGAKKYLLHEDMNQLDKFRKYQNRMWWLDRICKTLWLIFFTWAFFSTGLYTYLCNTLNDLINSIFSDLPI